MGRGSGGGMCLDRWAVWVVGMELWIRWVVVWILVGFFGLFDGGSSGLNAVCVASLVAPMVVL